MSYTGGVSHNLPFRGNESASPPANCELDAKAPSGDVLLSLDPFDDDWKQNAAFLLTMRSNMMAVAAPKGLRLAQMIVEQFTKGQLGRFVEHLAGNCHELVVAVELHDDEAAQRIQQILLRPCKPHERVSKFSEAGPPAPLTDEMIPVSASHIKQGQPHFNDGQDADSTASTHQIPQLSALQAEGREFAALPLLPITCDGVDKALSFRPPSFQPWGTFSPAPRPRQHEKQRQVYDDAADTLLRFHHDSRRSDEPHLVAPSDDSPRSPVVPLSCLHPLTRGEESWLGTNDVVTGHFHELFHRFVLDHYLFVKEPMECSRLLVQAWRHQGGRFLDRDAVTGELVVDIGDDRARNRVLMTWFNLRASNKGEAFQEYYEEGEQHTTGSRKRHKSPLPSQEKMKHRIKYEHRSIGVHCTQQDSSSVENCSLLYNPDHWRHRPIQWSNKIPPTAEKKILHEIGTPRAFHAEQTSIKALEHPSSRAGVTDKNSIHFTIKAGRNSQFAVSVENIPNSDIQEVDVLYDRANVRHHVGNVRCRKWLEDYSKKTKKFRTNTDTQLSLVALNYVWASRSSGGRFLGVAGEGWRDVGDEVAVSRTFSMLKLLRSTPSLTHLDSKNDFAISPTRESRNFLDEEEHSPLPNINLVTSNSSWEKPARSLQLQLVAVRTTGEVAHRHFSIEPANLFSQQTEGTALPDDMGRVHDVMFSSKGIGNPRFNKHCDESLYRHQMTTDRASGVKCSKSAISAIIDEWEMLHPPGRFFAENDDQSWVQYPGYDKEIQQKLRSRLSSMHISKDTECLDADVLIGKGDCYRRNHPGNERLYELIMNTKKAFLAATTAEEHWALSCEIGKTITNEGGFFRRYEKRSWQKRTPATTVVVLIMSLLKREVDMFDEV